MSKSPTTKKRGDRVKRIRLPQFNYTVIIHLSDEPGEVYGRLTGDYDFWGENTNALHMYDPLNMRSCLIFYHYPDVHSIAHEAFHAVWRLFEVIGAAHENEIMAYHVGFISEQVFRFAFAEFQTKSKTKKKTKRSTVA